MVSLPKKNIITTLKSLNDISSFSLMKNSRIWGLHGLTSADCQSPGTQWPIAVPEGRTNPKSIPCLKTRGETWDRDHAMSTGEDMLMQLKLSFLDNFVQAQPFKYYSKQPLHILQIKKVTAAQLYRRYWHRFGFVHFSKSCINTTLIYFVSTQNSYFGT